MSEPTPAEMRNRLADNFTASDLLCCLSTEDLTRLYAKVALLMGWDDDEEDDAEVQ